MILGGLTLLSHFSQSNLHSVLVEISLCLRRPGQFSAGPKALGLFVLIWAHFAPLYFGFTNDVRLYDFTDFFRVMRLVRIPLYVHEACTAVPCGFCTIALHGVRAGVASL